MVRPLGVAGAMSQPVDPRLLGASVRPEDLPLDAEGFRSVAGRYATGVVAVTTVLDGIDHVMTANSFTSVSLDPLLALFCVSNEARFGPAVRASGAWGISILAQDAQSAAAWFAKRGRPLPDQLDSVDHHRGVTGAALLNQALGWLECTTVAVHPAGDHHVIIGQVCRLAMAPRPAEPLVYWTGRYHRGTGARIESSQPRHHGRD